MNSTNTNIITSFLKKISSVYSVSIWNTTSLSEYFGIQEECFLYDKERALIYFPLNPDLLNIQTSLLVGTFFFLNSKRMIRGIPYAYCLNSDYKYENSDDIQVFEKAFLELPGSPLEKELKLDSINLRLFKLGKQICCATRFEPLIIPSTRPKVAHEALEYLYKYHNQVFELLQEGFVLYFDYLDPNYSDTAARTVYLRSVATSKGLFLNTDKIKEFSSILKMPMLKEFGNISKVPVSVSKWHQDCNLYIQQIERLNSKGLYLKTTIDIGSNNTDSIYLYLKNPQFRKLHLSLNNPEQFLQKQKQKLQSQLPENVKDERFNNIFKREIYYDFSLEMYEFLMTL